MLVRLTWLVLVGVKLFDGESSLKKCLSFDGLYGQETIWQNFPMNCSKIDHSYEAFKHQFGRNISVHLHSANNNSFADL